MVEVRILTQVEEKCTCGCGTDIITVDNMVFSDHTSKWMDKSEWDKMYKPELKMRILW